MRLPTKPEADADQHGDLAADLAGQLHAECSITSLESVVCARTISKSFITLAGEKKCRPITASGRLVTEAISSMLRPEVFGGEDRARLADRVQQW